MKTAIMGFGDVIVSRCKHKKCDGQMIIFSKAKKRMPILPIDNYKENPISRKELGKNLFSVYFKDKDSLKRFIDQMIIIYEEWECGKE